MVKTQPSPLIRSNISDELVGLLREQIVDGALPAGRRINEVHLSAELGVSRTPLREALSRLVAEGALISVPRIGFVVCPLAREEVEQIYPIRAILDCEALRISGLPTVGRLKRLEELNKQIVAAPEAEDVISLDDAWHLELIASCPNSLLINLIKQFIRRTHRYEVALMRERHNVRVAVDYHERIIAALRGGDLAKACSALHQNIVSGQEPIIAWLKSIRSTDKRIPGKEMC
jgi:DNA-binding GntR family transcriptional regulator